jgi:FHA domain-containing protein
MARLLIKTAGIQNQSMELKLGVNRVGRSPDSDFEIPHPTVSNEHCEIILLNDAVMIRDSNSTNGTFVDDTRIQEVRLLPGQTVHLGEIELFVENTDVAVAIPKFDFRPDVEPPIVLADGSVNCSRHPHAHVTHKCTNCKEVMCDACVRTLRRKGGKVLKLCPLCGNVCERIGESKPKKKSFFGFLPKTVKLIFTRSQPIHKE